MNLSSIVSGFRGLRIAVIGDRMVDRYFFGRVTRLSQEAPVPVFVVDRVEDRPGGSDNVSENLKALGVEALGIESPLTAIKNRYLHGHQQLFRVDEDTPWNSKDREAWIASLVSYLVVMKPHALIISDYAKGTCAARVCAAVIRYGEDHTIPVIVDPKGESWSKYDGATVICPNAHEFAALRVSAPEVDILEKRGEHGIQIHYRNNRSGPLIAASARHVYDVTGAGDTVVASVAAALAVGATLEQAAQIGCIAAGYVVGEVGTSACPLSYLESECESYSPVESSIPSMAGTGTS